MNLFDYINPEEETVANFYTTESPVFNVGAIPYQMIVRNDVDLKHIDIAAALEDTLHRLLDNGIDDDEIASVTGMEPFDEFMFEDDTFVPVDNGYVIPGAILCIEYPEKEIDER